MTSKIASRFSQFWEWDWDARSQGSFMQLFSKFIIKEAFDDSFEWEPFEKDYKRKNFEMSIKRILSYKGLENLLKFEVIYKKVNEGRGPPVWMFRKYLLLKKLQKLRPWKPDTPPLAKKFKVFDADLLIWALFF